MLAQTPLEPVGRTPLDYPLLDLLVGETPPKNHVGKTPQIPRRIEDDRQDLAQRTHLRQSLGHPNHLGFQSQ